MNTYDMKEETVNPRSLHRSTNQMAGRVTAPDIPQPTDHIGEAWRLVGWKQSSICSQQPPGHDDLLHDLRSIQVHPAAHAHVSIRQQRHISDSRQRGTIQQSAEAVQPNWQNWHAHLRPILPV
jgi:hypothetical protein